MEKWSALECQFIKTSRYTGKQYKTWEFIGWSKLPDLSKVEHTIKGKWAIVKGFDKLERYDLESIVEQ